MVTLVLFVIITCSQVSVWSMLVPYCPHGLLAFFNNIRYMYMYNIYM